MKLFIKHFYILAENVILLYIIINATWIYAALGLLNADNIYQRHNCVSRETHTCHVIRL